MIRTCSKRRLRSENGPDLEIEICVMDEPATFETWCRSADRLANEFGKDLLDIHLMLFKFAPHIYAHRDPNSDPNPH